MLDGLEAAICGICWVILVGKMSKRPTSLATFWRIHILYEDRENAWKRESESAGISVL